MIASSRNNNYCSLAHKKCFIILSGRLEVFYYTFRMSLHWKECGIVFKLKNTSSPVQNSVFLLKILLFIFHTFHTFEDLLYFLELLRLFHLYTEGVDRHVGWSQRKWTKIILFEVCLLCVNKARLFIF